MGRPGRSCFMTSPWLVSAATCDGPLPNRCPFVVPRGLHTFIPRSTAGQSLSCRGLQTNASAPLSVRRCRFFNRLLARRQAFEFGQRLKELLHFAGWLVGIDDLGRGLPAPRVLYVARDEHGFTERRGGTASCQPPTPPRRPRRKSIRPGPGSRGAAIRCCSPPKHTLRHRCPFPTPCNRSSCRRG